MRNIQKQFLRSVEENVFGIKEIKRYITRIILKTSYETLEIHTQTFQP